MITLARLANLSANPKYLEAKFVGELKLSQLRFAADPNPLEFTLLILVARQEFKLSKPLEAASR